MSEDEKKAIESLKIKAEYIGENYSFGKQGIRNLKKDLKIALNYINKQDKVIELMYQDIESEYLGTSYMEYYSLENYYRRAEEEND